MMALNQNRNPNPSLLLGKSKTSHHEDTSCAHPVCCVFFFVQEKWVPLSFKGKEIYALFVPKGKTEWRVLLRCFSTLSIILLGKIATHLKEKRLGCLGINYAIQPGAHERQKKIHHFPRKTLRFSTSPRTKALIAPQPCGHARCGEAS